MRKIVLFCAVLCVGLFASNEQDKQEICGESSENLFDALKNCGQRFEQAADEFKGFLDSKVVSEDANKTQSMPFR